MAQVGNFAGSSNDRKAEKKIELLVKRIKKIHSLQKVILANGAYSRQEELAQSLRIDEILNNCKDETTKKEIEHEMILVAKGWRLRRAYAQEACAELGGLMECLEKELALETKVRIGEATDEDMELLAQIRKELAERELKSKDTGKMTRREHLEKGIVAEKEQS